MKYPCHNTREALSNWRNQARVGVMLAVFNATKLASILASTSLLTQTETFSRLQKEELSDIFAVDMHNSDTKRGAFWSLMIDYAK